MILKRFLILLITLSLVGCSSQHVLKGNLSSSKDINVVIPKSEGDEALKKSTASIVTTLGMLILLGGMMALGDKYGEKK